jgi:hypothetical protein
MAAATRHVLHTEIFASDRQRLRHPGYHAEFRKSYVCERKATSLNGLSFLLRRGLTPRRGLGRARASNAQLLDIFSCDTMRQRSHSAWNVRHGSDRIPDVVIALTREAQKVSKKYSCY